MRDTYTDITFGRDSAGYLYTAPEHEYCVLTPANIPEMCQCGVSGELMEYFALMIVVCAHVCMCLHM